MGGGAWQHRLGGGVDSGATGGLAPGVCPLAERANAWRLADMVASVAFETTSPSLLEKKWSWVRKTWKPSVNLSAASYVLELPSL